MSLQVNNLIPPSYPRGDTQVNLGEDYFSQAQLQTFKSRAQHDEAGAFQDLVLSIQNDLSEDDKLVIMEEIEAKNNMILMIFRFFLQSREYQFFVRRLKNVAMTKLSLKQLRANESILIQRQEEKNKSFLDKDSVDQQASNPLTQSRYSTPKRAERPPYPHSSGVTPNSNKSTLAQRGTESQLLSSIKTADQSYQAHQNKPVSFKLGSSAYKPSPKIAFLKNGDNFLQQDEFIFRSFRCGRGLSPKVERSAKAVTMSQVISSLSDLGVALPHYKDYIKECQPRIGPQPSLVGLNEVVIGGGATPIQIQSDSDAQDCTPPHSNEREMSKPTINSLTANIAQRQLLTKEEPSSPLFHSMDAQYIMNILRHQASKNHNKIEEDDLALCLQIVSRQSTSNAVIQREVAQLYSEIFQSQKDNQLTFRNLKDSQRFLLFEQLIGPITAKTMISKEDVQVEQVIKQSFDNFRLQFGMKLIPFKTMTGFIRSTFDFLTYKVAKVNQANLASIIDKMSQDYITQKGMQFEDAYGKLDLHDWIVKELKGLDNDSSFQNSVSTLGTSAGNRFDVDIHSFPTGPSTTSIYDKQEIMRPQTAFGSPEFRQRNLPRQGSALGDTSSISSSVTGLQESSQLVGSHGSLDALKFDYNPRKFPISKFSNDYIQTREFQNMNHNQPIKPLNGIPSQPAHTESGNMIISSMPGSLTSALAHRKTEGSLARQNRVRFLEDYQTDFKNSDLIGGYRAQPFRDEALGLQQSHSGGINPQRSSDFKLRSKFSKEYAANPEKSYYQHLSKY